LSMKLGDALAPWGRDGGPRDNRFEPARQGQRPGPRGAQAPAPAPASAMASAFAKLQGKR
jgi:protein Tex